MNVPAEPSPERSPGWLSRFASFLIAYRRSLLIIAVLLTLLAIWPATQLTLDESIESLYAPDNPHLQAYLRSKRWFGGDEFVVVAYRDPDLFNSETQLSKESYQEIVEFSGRLAEIPGVQADSVQTLADSLRFPWGRSRTLEFLEGMLVGSDRQTTAIVMRLEPERQAPVPRPVTFARIRELADAHNPPAYVVGEPVQINDMFRYVEEDGLTLGVTSTALLMLVIFVLFRNVRWMLLPIAVVQATLIWTKAILVLSRMQLSMVSSILDSLITIVGIATVMHVTLHFREYRQTLDRVESLRRTTLDLVVPIFWITVTTAGGFAVLLSSSIEPVRSFGIMTTLASMLILLTTATILPGGILLGRRHADPQPVPGEMWMLQSLHRVTAGVLRHPFPVACLTALLSGFTGIGLLFSEIETDFSKNFREDTPIVQSLNFVEERLGGAGNWEVNFPAPKQLTQDFLDKVRALADDLRTMPRGPGDSHLTKVVALTDGLDFVPSRFLFRTLSLETRLQMLQGVQPEFIPSLYNPGEGRMRIMLRAFERQPAQAKLDLIADVTRTARDYFPQAEATGLYVLLAHLVQSLLGDQVTSFIVGSAVMLAMMVAALRSLRLGLISLVPNIFPLVLVIGSLGWLDVKVNIGIAMISSVSLGLTIDSSIVYLMVYQRARRRGLDANAALWETQQTVGLALVLTNIALICGFSVLALSHLIPLVYFGVLLSMAMLGGLIGNLILLPLLLPWGERPAAQSSP